MYIYLLLDVALPSESYVTGKETGKEIKYRV
jgi:hypothetical protein